MTTNVKLIITNHDLGVPRSMTLSTYDAEIKLPMEPGTYQYLILGDERTEDILVTRIAVALYLEYPIECDIEIHNVYISSQSKALYKELMILNHVTYRKDIPKEAKEPKNGFERALHRFDNLWTLYLYVKLRIQYRNKDRVLIT